MAKNTKTSKQYLVERARRAGIPNPEKLTMREIMEHLQQLKEKGIDLRKFNGGHNNKKLKHTEGIKEQLKRHLEEEVELVVVDREKGETRRVRKSRLLAILDVLAEKAIKQKDVSAAREYLDRTLGKPISHIEMQAMVRDERAVVEKQSEEVLRSLALHGFVPKTFVNYDDNRDKGTTRRGASNPRQQDSVGGA